MSATTSTWINKYAIQLISGVLTLSASLISTAWVVGGKQVANQTKMADLEKQITQLQAQRGDETRWVVEQHTRQIEGLSKTDEKQMELITRAYTAIADIKISQATTITELQQIRKLIEKHMDQK